MTIGVCAPAIADTVWMKNGDKLSGKIKVFDGGKLLLLGLRRLMPVQSPVPFAVTGEPSEIDLLLFVHRVQGLAPGLYWLDLDDEAVGG